MSNSKNVVVNLDLGHKATVKTQKTNEGFTHDWEVFVKGNVGAQIESFIEKVVFYLHTSFDKPKRVLRSPPYKVCEKGYGGFNLPIEIYFKTNEEPRKTKFEYDLYLQSLDSAPIANIRREKLTFLKPNEEFRRKLLQGGGSEVSNAEDSRMNEKSSKSRPSNGAKTKPVARHHAASSSTLNNHTTTAEVSKKVKETKKEVSKPKEPDQFTELFGEIIKKGITQKAEKKPPPKEKSSTSLSTTTSDAAKKDKPRDSTKSPSTEKDALAKKETKEKEALSKKRAEREDKERDKDKDRDRDREKNRESSSSNAKDKRGREKRAKETIPEDKKASGDGKERDRRKDIRKEYPSLSHPPPAKRGVSPSLPVEPEGEQSSKKKKRKEMDVEGGGKRSAGEEDSRGGRRKREDKGRGEKKGKHDKREKKESEKIKPPTPLPTQPQLPPTSPSPPPIIKEEKKKSSPPKPPPTQATRGRPRKDVKRGPPSVSPTAPPSRPPPSSKAKPKTKSSPAPPNPLPSVPPKERSRSRSRSSTRSRSPPCSISSSSPSSRSSSPGESPPPHSPTSPTSLSPSHSRSRSSSRSRSRSRSRSSLSSSKSHSKSPSLKSVSRSASRSESRSRSKSKSGSSSSSCGSSPSRGSHGKGVGERGGKGDINPLKILLADAMISESSSDSEGKPLLPPKGLQKVGRSTPSSSAPASSPKPPSIRREAGKGRPISPLSSDESASDGESQPRGRGGKRRRRLERDCLPETNGTPSRGKSKESDSSPPPTLSASQRVPNGTSGQQKTPLRPDLMSQVLRVDFSQDYLRELLDLRTKILRSFSDRAKVQEIVKIIGCSASFQLRQAHFTFDLCELDRQTIRKLQHCLS